MQRAEIKILNNTESACVLAVVKEFVDRLHPEDAAKMRAQLEMLLKGRTEELVIKTLRGKIKELIVKRYRIIFFKKEGMIYVVDAFKKQSKKTPQHIIERSEAIYKQIK